MKVDNKKELAYVMDFYGIKEFPIFDESRGSYACGYIVRNDNVKDGVEYSTKKSAYRFDCVEFAFIRAFKQINNVVDFVQNINNKITAIVIYYRDKKSEEITWEGTYDELFEKLEEENRHLRYCNGYYYTFKDMEMNKLHTIWYALISEGRKFNLYYGNGIVD